ncbi:MAG: hypothetical protein OER22_01135 [Gammaproteobacteria bacterium]|nr:hypothetical protein [Gammaproteobacteria bacterium]MDH3372493.1 hypothetical protein [Gammaproteobacteria bacterium]MDH3410495.1 hypothetical protein [Gammaproteobacteria bacterium]MDH3551195.1 hypothetical protein [Gammaproteobacteria bacterium]
MAQWNMLAGWTGMIFGLLTGAAIGLFFHQESFAGGYASFRRRMLRLGHVAFFALGIINVVFALSLTTTEVVLSYPKVASLSLVAGAVLMPLTCYLSAWKKPFRHLFPLPVVCVAITLVLILQGIVTL